MTRFEKGAKVRYRVYGPGARNERALGTLRCIVLNAGIEYDLVIDPLEEGELAVTLLRQCDMTLAEIHLPGVGYVLRNCQPEHVFPVTATLTQEV